MMRTSSAARSVWAGAAVLALGGCTLVAGLDKDFHPIGGSTGGGGEASTASSTATSTGVASSTTTGGASCVMAVDCALDSPCATHACTAGQCVATIAAEGQVVPDQAGNCEKTQCMGGIPTTVEDPADFGDDGDPCTVDGCDQGGPTHVAGNDGAACGSAGHHCSGGSCLECGDASQCPQGPDPCTIATCIGGACGFKTAADGMNCAAATACMSVGSCSAGACVQAPKSNGITCNAGAGKCAGGQCCVFATCGVSGDVCCAFGQYCNAAQQCKP